MNMKTNYPPRLEGIAIENLQTKQQVLISILDIDGKLIRKTHCDKSQIQLNSNNLNSGTYYWKAQFENIEIASGKFIIGDK